MRIPCKDGVITKGYCNILKRQSQIDICDCLLNLLLILFLLDDAGNDQSGKTACNQQGTDDDQDG